MSNATDTTTIGQEVQEYRDRYGKARNATATALGVSPETLRRWENGDQDPSEPEAVRSKLVGLEVAAWRRANGLTLDDAAALLERDRSTVWRWEQGRAVPEDTADVRSRIEDHRAGRLKLEPARVVRG